MSEFLKELQHRNYLLYRFGMLNLIALGTALVLSFVDHTIITGINAWIKPMKFALSIAIYSWTFAWLLHYLPSEKKRNFISWGVVICMFVENALIFLQAARGIKSHFNNTTSLDGAIFSTMGLFIALNTLLIVYTLILFLSPKIQMEKPMLWAWRAGLFFFFIGGISGGIMAGILHHAIGGPDDGPGIPFFNWSTLFGDIRSAHFITLHGLQAIPIAAFIIMRYAKNNAGVLVLLTSFIYLDICIFLHWLAFSGRPLFPA